MEAKSPAAAPAGSPATTKKITVFTPSEIKKIGLDKMILTQIKQGVAKKVVTSPDGTTKTLTPLKHSFCANLKMKMQKALQENKATVVTTSPKKESTESTPQGTGTDSSSPVVRKFVIIKSNEQKKEFEEKVKSSVSEGKKIKIVQNQVIGSGSPGNLANLQKKVKCYDNANPPRKAGTLYNGSPDKNNKVRAFLDLDEEEPEEEIKKTVVRKMVIQKVVTVTPSFTKPPIHTYKRKRPGDEEDTPKKTKPEGATEDEADIRVVEKHIDNDNYEDDIEDIDEQEEEEEEEHQAVVILSSSKKPGRKSIIEQVRDDDDGDITWTEIPPAKIPKKRGRKSKAELEMLARMKSVQPPSPQPPKIPKKRGRKSKAELALIAEMKAKQEEEEREYDMEDADEDDDMDEGDVEYITLEVSPSVETAKEEEQQDAPPKVYKKRGRKSKAELAELALLAKQKQEEDPSEDDEDDDEDSEEEERISAAVSPTRHGRIPKRNKLFDNYVTPLRKRSTSDAAEPPKKVAPPPPPPKVVTKVTTGKKRGRKPKNWKPEDDEEVEEIGDVGEVEEVAKTDKGDGSDGISSNEDDNAMVDLDRHSKEEKTSEDAEVQEPKVVKVIKESSIIPKKRGWKPSDDEEDPINKKKPEDESKDDNDDKATPSKDDIDEEDDSIAVSETSKPEDDADQSTKTSPEKSEKDPLEISNTEVDQETTNGEEDRPQQKKPQAKSTSKEEVEEDFKGCFADATPVQSSPRRRGRPKGSGRGGKRDADEEERPQPDDDEGELPKVKRRGRKRKAAMTMTIAESPSTSAAGVDGVDEPSQKRRAARDNAISIEHVADLTPSTPKAETTTAKMYRYLVANLVVSIRHTMATSVESPKGPGQTITCAICKHHCKPTEWKLHKQRRHNNVAWSITEKPLDLDNQYVVMAELNSLYPAKPFFCEICNDCKKSSLGYLTHRLSCNKTQDEIDQLRLQCAHCPKRILPHQIAEHENFHKRQEAIHLKSRAENPESQPDDGTPRKRSAARKASEMIQQVSQELSNVSTAAELTIRALKPYFAKNNYNNPSVRSLVKIMLESADSIECLFPSCNRKFEEITPLFDHMYVCSQQPQLYFICKLCLALFETSANIKKHLNMKHADTVTNQKDEEEFKTEPGDENNDSEDPDDEESGDDEDSEIGEKKSRRKERKTISANPQVHVNAFWKLQKFSKLQSSKTETDSCPPGVNYLIYAKMLEFCKANYDQRLFPQFPFIKSSWFALNKNYVAEFLPKMKTSIAIGQISKQKITGPTSGATFSKYKLFQTSIINGVVNIYCGGPITAMAWAPTNYNCSESMQILAVAIHQDPSHRYFLGKMHTNKSIIQLWNFGALNNKKAIVEEPKLELCIAHSYGGIFDMAWCPSGCIEDEGTRLGLLMVCATDGGTYCYSIGQSNLLIDKIFKPKPTFKLVANSKECEVKFGMCDSFPLRISWSKAAEHKYVAVGYSNGIVAMFNLGTESNLLKTVDEHNVQVFYPYMMFKADNRAITALSLNHLSGGNRYLATSSNSRIFKFWDLHSSHLRPLISSKRSCALNILWPINCLTVMTSNDDSSSNAYLNTQAIHLPDFDYARPTTMFYSHSAVRSISGSDWGGVVYQANEAGEVAGLTYRDMYPVVIEVPFKKFLCSNTSIIPINEDERDDVDTFINRNDYKMIQDKFQLLFHDYKMAKPDKIVKQERLTHALSSADYGKFPMQAATVTCTNNNRYSFLFTAVGYNIGFVRVYHSDFLNVS